MEFDGASNSIKSVARIVKWGMMKCKHCGSEKIVKRGLRKSLRLDNQIYVCRDCGRRFSQKQGRYDDALILFAASTYNSGKSLCKTVALIRDKFKINVNPATVSRWTRKFGKSYLRLRGNLLSKHKGVEPIVHKQFIHSGLIYRFSLHNLKLREFCRHKDLAHYLISLDEWIDRYFTSGSRCSQMQTVEHVEVVPKKNIACNAVGNVLGACKDLRERHAIVQQYLLHNDSSTVAVEVPVWMSDRTSQRSVDH